MVYKPTFTSLEGPILQDRSLGLVAGVKPPFTSPRSPRRRGASDRVTRCWLEHRDDLDFLYAKNG